MFEEATLNLITLSYAHFVFLRARILLSFVFPVLHFVRKHFSGYVRFGMKISTLENWSGFHAKLLDGFLDCVIREIIASTKLRVAVFVVYAVCCWDNGTFFHKKQEECSIYTFISPNAWILCSFLFLLHVNNEHVTQSSSKKSDHKNPASRTRKNPKQCLSQIFSKFRKVFQIFQSFQIIGSDPCKCKWNNKNKWAQDISGQDFRNRTLWIRIYSFIESKYFNCIHHLLDVFYLNSDNNVNI